MTTRTKIKDAVILYVEDDSITRNQLSQFLKRKCKKLYTAQDGAQGLELFKQYQPDIVITDIEMPIIDGLTMAREIRQVSLYSQIIILSAYKKTEYLLEAVNLQLTQYLIKPLSLEKITKALKLSANYLDCKRADTKQYFTRDKYYDVYTKELIDKNNIIKLSKNERTLLDCLLDKYPAPTSYESIDALVYDHQGTKNSIKLLVGSLRNKLTKESLVNVSGFGYKITLRNNK